MNAVRLIEKHIDGTILLSENEYLQNELASSKTLQKEFRLRQEVENMFADNDEARLRSKLQLAYNSYQADQRNYKTVKRVLYAAAAVSGIAVGGVITNSLINSKTDINKLYIENFQPYPAISTHRSANLAANNSNFFKAMLYYKNGDYSSAINEFDKILGAGYSDYSVHFYLGISLMEVKEFTRAREYLTIVSESNSLLNEQSQWYCALCYLGEREVEKAKEILLALKNNDGRLSQKANELINQLSEE